MTSRWLELDGPLHYGDFGGPDDGQPVVLVHGLGGSHLIWASLGPLLRDPHRVLAPDLAGFGRTASAGRGTDLASNGALLRRFIAATTDQPVVLVGNSMGGLLATALAAEHPDRVAGLVLVGSAFAAGPRALPGLTASALLLPCWSVTLGRLVLATRRRILSPAALMDGVLKLCTHDPSHIDPAIIRDHVALFDERSRQPDRDRDFAVAAQSTIRMVAHRHDGSMSPPVPTLLIHGERDRLVPIRAARHVAQANPRWTLITLSNVGHLPQLESPAPVAAAMREWIASQIATTSRA